MLPALEFGVETIPLIHFLPNEILSHIFLLGHRFYPLGDPEAQTFLITASAVCRLWRNIAISNPFLWTTIRYCQIQEPLSTYPDGDDVATVPSRVDAFIRRSKDASLDLLLTMNDDGLDVALILIPMLIPHFHRCRTIWIDLYRLEFAEDISLLEMLFPLEGELGRLERFELAAPYSYPYIRKPLALFGKENYSRKLKHLMLRGEPPLVDTTNLKTSNVTELDIHLDMILNHEVIPSSHPTLNPLPLLAQSCSKITHLTLNLSRISDLPPDQGIINLPLLKSFTTNKDSLGPISGLLACPGIEEFRLDPVSWDIPDPVELDSILELAEDQFEWSNLQCLCFRVHLHPREVERVLAALSAAREIIVEDVALQGLGLGLIFLEALRLTSAPSEPFFVPKLGRLCIYSHPPRGQVVGAVAADVLFPALWEARPTLRVEASRGSAGMRNEEFEELLLAKPGLFSEFSEPAVI